MADCNSVFEIPNGGRAFLQNIILLDTGVIKEFYATATDQYQLYTTGRTRRLFIDASIVFEDGGKAIWLGVADGQSTITSEFFSSANTIYEELK